MTKNRWQSVSYHRNPRLTFNWRIHCYIRNFRNTVYNTKNNFKFTSNRTRQGRKYYFNRHLRSPIPYSAKYEFKMPNALKWSLKGDVE